MSKNRILPVVGFVGVASPNVRISGTVDARGYNLAAGFKKELEEQDEEIQKLKGQVAAWKEAALWLDTHSGPLPQHLWARLNE